MTPKPYLKLLLAAFLILGTALATGLPAKANPEQQEQLPDRLNTLPTAAYSTLKAPASEEDKLQPQLWLEPWSSIVYQTFRHQNWEIYYAANDDSNPIRLTNHLGQDIQPSLNRGSTRIVFSSNRDGDYEIFVMNTDGSGLVQLTHNTKDDVYPRWSPDGSKIAFETYRDGQAEVYVMNADGSGQTRVTNHPDFDAFPSWSPDGTKLAFTSRRTGGYRIYTIKLDGTGLTQVSSQPYSLHPVWSPNGQQIAFDADGDGDGWQDLWLVNSDGLNPHLLHNPSGQTDAWANSWSPESEYIGFTEVSFIQSQGNWYWTNSFLLTVNRQSGGWSFIDYNSLLDWNPYLQATDGQKPDSSVYWLPEYSPVNEFQVQWAGTDFGKSGLRAYDVQYRLGNSVSWVNWLPQTTSTSHKFPATAGTSAQFQVRAYDYVYNYEAWPLSPDASTKFYTWYLAGAVTDNRQTPLEGVAVTVNPTPWASAVTDGSGEYEAWLIANGSHTLTAAQTGYAATVPTALNHQSLDTLYLPPTDNVIQNGTFESVPSLTGWVTTGTPAVSAPLRHSGSNGVTFGSSCTAPCLGDSEPFPWADMANIHLVPDKSGNLHMLWDGSLINEAEKSYYSFRTVDGQWVAPVLLWSDFSATTPVGALDANETLHVLWSSGTGDLYYKTRSASGVWSAATKIMTIANAKVTDVVIDKVGTIHALVQYNSGFGYLEKSLTESWHYQIVASTGLGSAAMALGPDGRLHFVWSVDLLSSFHRFPIYHIIRYPDGNWTAPESLFANIDYFVPKPSGLMVSSNNTLHIFWYTNNSIHHAFLPPDGSWSTPIQLPNAHGEIFDVALDSRDELHLINLDRSTANSGIYYRQWTNGGGWQTTTLLNPEYPHNTPAVAVDGHDTVHLMWSAGFLDGVYYQSNTSATGASASSVSQTVTIPVGMANPTLAFMARQFRNLPGDSSGLQLQISNGTVTSTLPVPHNTAAWSQSWIDMSAWQGQTVTVTFQFEQQPGDLFTQAAVDDVSLGSAYPDTWVKLDAAAHYGVPGDSLPLTVLYGNQSNIDVADGVLTLTLPAHLSFVSANISPTSLTPLTWAVGNIPAETMGQPLVVTVSIKPGAPFFTTLSPHVSLNTSATELQTGNNEAQADIVINRFQFLPIVTRN